MSKAALERPAGGWQWPALLSLCVLGLHLLIAWHLQGVSDSFLRGDRSDLRMEKIEFVLHGSHLEVFAGDFGLPVSTDSTLPQRIAVLGAPGDFLPHALLYSIGGAPLIMSTHLSLLLAACLALMWLAQRCGLPAAGAASLALLYALLPGNLLQVHALVVEGLFVPLLTLGLIAIWAAGRQRWSGGLLVLGITCLAAAVFVRMQLLLLPPLLAAVAWQLGAPQRRARSGWILIAMLPVLAWSMATSALFEHGRIAPVGADSSWHLQKRLERMSHHVGRDLLAQLPAPDRPTLGQFLQQTARHPGAFARTALIDNINNIANPGQVYLLRQLDFTPADRGALYWAELRDQAGIRGVLAGLWQWSPLFALAFVGMALLWLGVLLLAAAALYRLWRARWRGEDSAAPDPLLLAMLSVLILYTLASMQLAGNSRWSLRQPAEFAVLLLAALQAYSWLAAAPAGRWLKARGR